jgi:hypothetical protein
MGSEEVEIGESSSSGSRKVKLTVLGQTEAVVRGVKSTKQSPSCLSMQRFPHYDALLRYILSMRSRHDSEETKL